MWLDQQVSLYKTHFDNIGTPATFDSILFWRHDFDFKTIYQLRKLDRTATDYELKKKALKSKLPCYTPASLLESKAKDNVKLIERSGLMQLDFDYKDISDYDIEEIKQAVFSLPFIAYCSLSCSGDGFYALALIAEPERLSEYAERCFEMFEKLYGIKLDTSKGKKIENLRYISYDANKLVRPSSFFPEDPIPLKIKKLITAKKNADIIPAKKDLSLREDAFVKRQLDKLINASAGNRTNTIKNVAHTLGGKKNYHYLQEIKNIISDHETFADERKAFLRCADDCFNRGMQRPF